MFTLIYEKQLIFQNDFRTFAWSQKSGSQGPNSRFEVPLLLMRVSVGCNQLAGVRASEEAEPGIPPEASEMSASSG